MNWPYSARGDAGFGGNLIAQRKTLAFRCSALVGLVPALVLTAALTRAGGDPWKSKPYQQWDNKDIQKIVNDSPWAKVVRVDVSWTVPGTDDGAGARPMGGVRPTMGGQMGGNAQPSTVSAPAPQNPQATFLVRWASSRTMREAASRRAVLAGQMKEEDANKELAHPVEVYQLLVTGADMQPFVGVDDGELKRGALLTTKKTKQRIIPSSVAIERTPNGPGIQAIVFSFPKKTPTGEATIAADEKGADFTCVAGAVRIQATFDIPKMDDPQGRDL